MKKIISNMLGNDKKNAKKDGDVVENSIILALFYLSKSVMPSGRFVYKKNINPKKNYADNQYGSLRHAGTLYSMYQCEKYQGKTVLKKKRYLASEYLIKNYIKKIDSNMYGLVSKIEDGAPTFLATSGGTGLALTALCNLLNDRKISLTILRKMGNFILYMQTGKGDFTPSFEFGTKQKSNVYAARYYPGEACLGLLNLYEVDKDERWLLAAKKGLFRLAQLAGKTKIEDMKFDHWGMLALQKLFSIKKNGLTKDEKTVLATFADKNVNLVLDKQIVDEKNARLGAFETTKSICGVATILEGLIAAYDCVGTSVLKMRIVNAASLGIAHIARYQVKVGELEGGIPKTHIWNTMEANNEDKEIRIDYVQHSLSALVTYKTLLKSAN